MLGDFEQRLLCTRQMRKLILKVWEKTAQCIVQIFNLFERTVNSGAVSLSLQLQIRTVIFPGKHIAVSRDFQLIHKMLVRLFALLEICHSHYKQIVRVAGNHLGAWHLWQLLHLLVTERLLSKLLQYSINVPLTQLTLEEPRQYLLIQMLSHLLLSLVKNFRRKLVNVSDDDHCLVDQHLDQHLRLWRQVFCHN